MRLRSRLLKSFVVGIISLAAFCLSTGARAAILMDNLGGGLGQSLTIDSEQRVALAFRLDSAQDGAWTFTVHAASTIPNDNTLVLQLVNDSGGTPGVSPLFSVSGGFVSAQLGYNIYTFTGSGQLNASTTYWLVASSSGGFLNEYDWFNRGTYIETGATFFDAQVDPGAGWVDAGASQFLSLQLGVTPVPEPAQTGAIAALVLVAFSLAHTFRGRVVSRLRKPFS